MVDTFIAERELDKVLGSLLELLEEPGLAVVLPLL